MHIFSISSKSEVGVSVFTAMYENSHCSEATLVLRHGSLTLVPVLLALTQWWYGGVLPCPLLRGAVTWEYPLVACPQPEAVDVSPVHLREISVLAFPSRRHAVATFPLSPLRFHLSKRQHILQVLDLRSTDSNHTWRPPPPPPPRSPILVS